MSHDNYEPFEEELKKLFQKDAKDFSKKVEVDRKKHEETTQSGQIGSSVRQWEKEQRFSGKIINTCVQQWLDAKITTARCELAIGMVLTLLIRGQWALWIIMIIFYKIHVRKLRADALNYDSKGDTYNEWMD